MRRAHGFTLVELLVVLVVLGLAGTAVLLTAPGGDQAFVRETDRLAARLVRAGEEAVLTMRTVRVTVDARGYRFASREFDQWQALDGRAFAAVPWDAGTAVEGGDGNEEGRTTFVFDPLGAAAPAAVLLRRDGHGMRVSVDEAGEVAVDAVR